MSTDKYHIVYEEGTHNWSAYVEDLQGTCIATGATREECARDMQEAIEFHIEGLSPRERAADARSASVRGRELQR